MVNSNPETVSTDYDTSDMLFFEPLTHEDVLNICDRVKPDGIIVQFGGQTPLNLARGLENAGMPIIGTSVETIERAEDRELFAELLRDTGLRQPANAIARTMAQAKEMADKVGFPILVRPSFVLGGRAMELCYDHKQLECFAAEAFLVSSGRPVLIDRFLEDATEIDVDAISDGENVIVAGVLEHIEAAGIHSGDSACSIPPYKLPALVVQEIREATKTLARKLNVKGLMNIQFAVKHEDGRMNLYVIEVNPRASRTVPFVSKAVGQPLAKIAALVMAGYSLAEQNFLDDPIPRHVSVKESVFPFAKFAGVDTVLGPEMKSTGEVMGVSELFSVAFAKSQIAAGNILPMTGNVFISVNDHDKPYIAPVAKRLVELGYHLLVTGGTARTLEEADIPVTKLRKLQEGHPNIRDYMSNNDVALIINTPSGKGARTDEGRIRAAAVTHKVPYLTTLPAAEAAAIAMEAMHQGDFTVEAVQERFDD